MIAKVIILALLPTGTTRFVELTAEAGDGWRTAASGEAQRAGSAAVSVENQNKADALDSAGCAHIYRPPLTFI